MKIIADLHCHTLASTHAFNTVTEMVKKASELNFYAIAITDHGPDMKDAPHMWHFSNLIRQIPEEIDGVKVLKGAEANIIDYNGNLDILDSLLMNMDIVIASFHKPVIKESDIDKTTNAMANIATNPLVDIVGHCGSPLYEFDYKKIIKLFKENNKIIEINSNTYNIRKSSWDNCIKIAQLCKEIGCKISVNSDCHSIYSLGMVENALKMLNDIKFPQELIINSDIELLNKYLDERKERIKNIS